MLHDMLIPQSNTKCAQVGVVVPKKVGALQMWWVVFEKQI